MRPWLVPLAVLALTATGCGDEPERPAKRDGNALGGDASVKTLARAPVRSSPPKGAAWTAFRVTLDAGKRIEHRHPLSTVYAEQGAHRLDARTISPTGGAIVQSAQSHVHAAPDEPSTFWEVLLARPGTRLPGARGAERVFATEPLRGIPRRAHIQFLDVTLPPRGQTTVHTHPGPETIYVTNGPFDYENGIEGSTELDVGDLRSIPPNTPVQKRNRGAGKPRFLSWFIVDPDEEFAPPTRFESSG